ncbi:MAG: serine--tRNA ligase, partial [Proteobacteria bacterium]|nr:serine--tRNA ligase [Pseudomonadota bacterium]
MLDSQLLRNDLESVAEKLTPRGFSLDVAQLQDLERKRKALQTEQQELQAQRNKSAKEVGRLKASGEDATGLINETAGIGARLVTVDEALSVVQTELDGLLKGIPNIPHDSVPSGNSEDDNIEIRRWGNPAELGFDPLDHVSLGAGLKMMDFDIAAKITGSRFVVMSDSLARLHRALIQFMLDVHTLENGYRETYVPYLVNSDSLFGTGQLPKFADDQFMTATDPPYYLIPTAEVPVTNLYAKTVIDGNELPIKRVCHTPCFRSEAGSYGKDTRGMIRQHQFEKVELVQIVEPERSWTALEELTANAEGILQRLDLPYRVVTLCGGDLGFSAA